MRDPLWSPARASAEARQDRPQVSLQPGLGEPKAQRLLRRLPIERTTKMFATRPQNVLEDIAAPAPPYWMKDVVIPVLEPTLASLIMQEHAAREILAF